MKLKHIAALVAAMAAGSANAGLAPMDGGAVAGNSSAVLVMLDSTGATTRGLSLDLGFNYSDFNATGTLSSLETMVNWDFASNTITRTDRQTGSSVVVSGPSENAWSAQVADFMANADANEVKFAIVAGSQRGSSPTAFLATGTPTAAQLNSQNSAATANFVQVNPMFTFNNTAGTHATATNGAYSMAATDPAYVGGIGAANYASSTSIGGWRNNLKWDGWTALGGSTNLRQLNATGQELVVGATPLGLTDSSLLNNLGTFSVAANGLSAQWMTATAVPEPSTYALMAVGLVGIAAAARRRKA